MKYNYKNIMQDYIKMWMQEMENILFTLAKVELFLIYKQAHYL